MSAHESDAERAAHLQDLFWLNNYHLRITQNRVLYLERLLNQAGVDYDLMLRCPDCDEELAASIDGTPADRVAILDHYVAHAEEDVDD